MAADVDIFQIALAIGALVAAALNYNQPRALIWIAVGALDFVLTAFYQLHAIPQLPHPFVTCLVDGTVVALISIFGRLTWEIWVRRCFMLSMLMSILFLAHQGITTRYVYVTMLEVCNWLALLTIGGTGIMRLIDAGVDNSLSGLALSRYRCGALHRVRAFLDAPRRKATFLARQIARRQP